MNRGSTWHIWDFHLHTPCSILNNQFGDPDDDATWDRYIDAIEETASELGIAAIGITDYFTIEGYKRVCEYQMGGRLQDIFIFPNIEFRVDTLIDNKRLNFHVLFSPDVPVNHIEENFLHDLYFVHEDEPFDGQQRRKLKCSNLIEFGETLRQQHKPFRDRSAFEIGCMNAKVDLADIKKALHDNRFSGKHLLVLPEPNFPGWDGQYHATRKQLYQVAHAVFSSNPANRAFCLGKCHPSVEEFIEEFKSLKPCIWGCDSHGLEERFLKPDGERYCWIKSEVTWEGLKQILYEPEARVRIQAGNPEPIKSYFTLDSVQIGDTQVNEELRIGDFETPLNPNLIALIGGRGSGKTALLDLIAACFLEGQKLADLPNSFYYRLFKGNRQRTTEAEPISVTLDFRSGDRFQKQVGRQANIFGQADILYLTQDHMDDYTANPVKLYEHIVDLVFSKSPDQRQAYDRLQEQAQTLQRDIQSINLEIQQLHEQVDSKLGAEQAEYAQQRGELLDYQKRLRDQEVQQVDSGQEAVMLTDQLKALKSRRDRMISLRDRCDLLLDAIRQFQEHYKSESETINSYIAALPELSPLQLLPTDLGQIDKVSQIIKTNTAILRKSEPITEKDIQKITKALGDLQGIDRTIAQLRNTIDSITREIELIDKRIKVLKEKDQKASELGFQRTRHYASLMQQVARQRLYLQSVIDNFETGQDDLLAGLTFSAMVDTSLQDEYIARIIDKVDGRVHSLESVKTDLGPIIESTRRQLDSFRSREELDELDSVLPLAERLCDWAQSVRLKRSTTESEFFNALFSPFFHIGLHIEFNDRPLEVLSMGERAVVLLKILLGLDDTPLLIDQPDEHLDNRYIYDELAPAFRSAKTRRQIMIATHNANLVVNTDAEQIILADCSEGTLSYTVGTLEDLDMRESIKTLLEGGDQAFKRREEKYGFRF